MFIGGGTPSLFSAEAMQQLISMIKTHLNYLPTMEVTMEANPGTVEQQKFNDFYAAGINRLSIGVQSFDDQKLQALGRIHTAGEARRAVEVARKAGFENINLDLMFGLPGQTPQQGLDDLQQAIDLGPQHISWYQLTIEPNTLFDSQPPVVPDDEEIWQLQQQGQSLLASHGYAQYEVSAYARDGFQCRHNLNYWQFGDYLALGAGAHGKLTRADSGEITRYWQKRQPTDYMQAAAEEKTSDREVVNASQVVFEFMLNALRLKQGFSLSQFTQHTGLPAARISAVCEQAIADELMLQQGEQYAASPRGYLFLNDLINRFAE